MWSQFGKDAYILGMVFFVVLLLSTVVSAEPHVTFCGDTNYTSNSLYEINLKRLLESLSANISLEEGFYKTSVGDGTNQVYGRVLCRSDVPHKVCKTCVRNASQAITRECNTRSAILWYELCQIQYSFQMLSIPVYTGKYPLSNDEEKNVSDPDQFSLVLRRFMESLSDKAVSDHSNRMFAIGKSKFSSNQTIYGLVQCTRDIAVEECLGCFKDAFGDLYGCCKLREGGTIFSRNCNVRFEMHKFYYESAGSPWKKIVVVGVIVVLIFLLAALIGCYFFCHRRSEETQKDEEKSQSALMHEMVTPCSSVITDEANLVNPRELPFLELETIKAATENFSELNKLGQGGFGTVYKGVLNDGKQVAVKRLSRKSWQGCEEFKNEVIVIAKLQHRNLVRLVGCGIEGVEKLLVYEYMPNKSLDTFISDSEKRVELNWDIRFNIIKGIARGLLYLHEHSRLKIIHRDLKPSNILLDHDMVAKISDFGMAKIFGETQSIANTKRIVGTYGYMAPEYAMEGLFSVKSDVFSFGVILLEIISGKRNNGFYLTGLASSFLAYAWQLWNDGKDLEFVDPLVTKSCTMDKVERCIHIGLLCVQEDPTDRPTMSSVVVLLESESQALPEPRQPAFSVGRVAHHGDQFSIIDPSLSELNLSSISTR